MAVVARSGRRMAKIWTVATALAPEGGTFNDSGNGTIPLSGTSVESHSHSGTGAGTIALSGAGTETNAHSRSATGQIPLSGTGTESWVPPAGAFKRSRRPQQGFGT